MHPRGDPSSSMDGSGSTILSCIKFTCTVYANALYYIGVFLTQILSQRWIDKHVLSLVRFNT